MDDFVRLVGPNRALELFGVKLVGVNAENGLKLLFTLGFIVVALLLGRSVRGLASIPLRRWDALRSHFWAQQIGRLATTILLVLGFASIWFDDPSRLATALGLVTAGLAFALQRVIMAVAGYLVLLQGKTFNVGDRITMGTVRGDVVAIGFIQTTIMEMGKPPEVQADDPAIWVEARQYSGRIITVSNAKIFEEPVYNYTRDFPYLWEEMRLPIAYAADHPRAEKILLEVARRHTVDIEHIGEQALGQLRRRYFMKNADLSPKVYFRLTDNWVELTVRFVVEERGIRDLKDAMSRDILAAIRAAGIRVASSTFEIVGLPPLEIRANSSAIELPLATKPRRPNRL